MASDSSTCCYRIDPADRLVWVDESWLAFARENGGGELADVTRVLQRSLWDFIAGEATRELYAEIHGHVRRSGRTMVFPIRCDSATMRRQVQLTISLEPSGDLFYDSALKWARPLDMLDPQLDRSIELLTMCSCCKRGQVSSEDWMEIDALPACLRLFDSELVGDLQYTVCPECEAVARTACDRAS